MALYNGKDVEKSRDSRSDMQQPSPPPPYVEDVALVKKIRRKAESVASTCHSSYLTFLVCAYCR
jgi:hypothetical protein